MYRKIGYTQIDNRVVALRDASTLKALNGWTGRLEVELNFALQHVRAERRDFVNKGIDITNVLQMGASKNTPPGSPAHNAVFRLLCTFLSELDLLVDGVHADKFQFQNWTYVDDPFLSWEEIVERIIASDIQYPTLGDMSGDKTTVGQLLDRFVAWVSNLSRRERNMAEITDRLERYYSHLTYRLCKGEVLTDPYDRSFFVNFLRGGPSDERSQSSRSSAMYVPGESSDPLVPAMFSRLKEVCLSGPLSRFIHLVSNVSREELIAAFAPAFGTAPLQMGYVSLMGPFQKYSFGAVSSLNYGDTDLMTAMRERYVTLGTPGASALDPQPEMVRFLHPSIQSLTADLDEVTIEAINPAKMQSEASPSLSFSWMSDWRNRRIYTDKSRALAEDLRDDLALKHKAWGGGGGNELGASLPPSDVFLSVDSAIADRMVSFNTPYTKKQSKLDCPVHFLRHGKLTTDNVDLSSLWSRQGTIFFQPALSEHMPLHLNMLMRPNANAMGYLIAELGLNTEEAMMNQTALTICYNYSELRHVLGDRQLPSVNLQSYITNILGR